MASAVNLTKMKILSADFDRSHKQLKGLLEGKSVMDRDQTTSEAVSKLAEAIDRVDQEMKMLRGALQESEGISQLRTRIQAALERKHEPINDANDELDIAKLNVMSTPQATKQQQVVLEDFPSTPTLEQLGLSGRTLSIVGGGSRKITDSNSSMSDIEFDNSFYQKSPAGVDNSFSSDVSVPNFRIFNSSPSIANSKAGNTKVKTQNSHNLKQVTTAPNVSFSAEDSSMCVDDEQPATKKAHVRFSDDLENRQVIPRGNPQTLAMVKFQSRTFGDDILGSEKMKITPLGAGSEVGRSCIIVEFKGKTIMMDCGIHPAYAGMSALPFFDEIDPASVDIVLITHFHLDHAAGLPFFMEKTNFKGKVFMTHPTKAIYKWLLSDYVKVSALSSEEQLYNDADLARSFERITAIDYHQEIEFEGIKFMAFNAGHVLGAAMFLIEVAGVKLLYTGDYSREEDRHLMAAEKPEVPLDVLVCESTYGTQSQQPRLERERRFTGQVHDIVRRGGRCLIPVFALGRAQELLLILDEYWQAHPELHQIPIYYASALAKKCMTVYQTYVNMMNEKIRKQIAFSNPFIFKHISYLRGMESFEDRGPCVMMASPGMLQNGLSRELFERWCPNKLNGVIIAGYCVEGTLAKQILSEPKEVASLNGTAMLPLKMSVEYISFSAHVDFVQNSQFIEECHAPNLVLVHGEATEMGRLKGALQHRFESTVAIFTPRNCETVELSFRGEKTVKVVGSLAAEGALKDGQNIVGVLLGKDFEYQLVGPEEVSEYSQLKRVVLKQRQAIPSHATISLLEFHLVNLFGRAQVEFVSNSLVIMKEFHVSKPVGMDAKKQAEFIVEWEGNVMNDMIADSIISVIMNADYSRSSVKETKSTSSHSHSHSAAKSHEIQGPSAALYLDVLKQYLIEYFGQVREDEDEAKYRFEMEVPGGKEERVVDVSVSMEDFSVECEEDHLKAEVQKVVSRITSLLDVDYIL